MGFSYFQKQCKTRALDNLVYRAAWTDPSWKTVEPKPHNREGSYLKATDRARVISYQTSDKDVFV